jgi:hypothetical protein
MITQSAQTALESLLVLSLRKSLAVMPEDRCEVSEASDAEDFPESRVVVLTSSSYVFRVMVLIYFDDDERTRAHFARRVHASAQEFDHQAFVDALCEAANMCSGGFNRELTQFYPHIGLSTPNILERRCADHIAALNAGLVRHFRVDINGVSLFHASMCVCDYDTMDFSYVPVAQEEAVSDGELELF